MKPTFSEQIAIVKAVAKELGLEPEPDACPICGCGKWRHHPPFGCVRQFGEKLCGCPMPRLVWEEP